MVDDGSGAGIQARRAIEALRAGVPNRDAVLELGSAYPDIEETFRQHLEEAKRVGVEPRSPAGFLVAGNFGSGKSHLLEHLQQAALRDGFVVSKIVISKETPLYDPVKLYRAAVRSATVPNRVGAALPQIASELEFDRDGYAGLYRWAQNPREIDQRFGATIFLYENARNNPELLDRIISFWGGDPIQVGEIRRELRQLGQASLYSINAIKTIDLAYQRFRFSARLMMAAGYSGWVLLFDEVDLVARYSFLQRAKSYAQIARWTGRLTGESFPGITSVMAITSDYESMILEGKNDNEVIPGKLGASPRESDHLIAAQAERGMRQIGTSMRLSSPSAAVIDSTYERVRDIHGRAYGWDPPAVSSVIERTTSTRMREYVRSWINEWDLRRLFPDHTPQIEVNELKFSYDEDQDLEAPSDGDAETPERDEQ